MRRLNIKILFALVLLLCIVGAGAYGLRKFNLGQNAKEQLRQADAAEKAGQRKTAAKHLRNYLALRPSDTGTMIRYGQMLDTLAQTPKDRLQAMLILEQVLRRKPGPGQGELHDTIRRRVVEINLSPEFRRFKDAQSHLRILLDEHPKDSQLHLQSGLCHEAAEKWDEAEKHYQQAIALDPQRVDGYVSRARVLRDHLQDPGEADKIMDALVAANPDDPKAYLERARYHEQVGQAEAARAETAAADKRTEAAHADLAEARKRAPEDADVLLESARLAANDEEKRDYLKEGLDHHPDDMRMYLSLAAVMARPGPKESSKEKVARLENVIKLLNEGIQRLPEAMELRFSLAEQLVEAGLEAEAEKQIQELRKAENIRRELVDYLQARLRFKQERYPEATEILQSVALAMEDTPSVAQVALELLGRCYLATDNPNQAQRAFRRALGLNPTGEQARRGLADALVRLEKVEDAIAEYRILERQAPECKLIIAELTLAQTLRTPTAERRWDTFEQILNEATQVMPEAVEVPILRAQGLAIRRQFDRAKTVLEQAREAKPQSVQLWTALAGLARIQGQSDEALDVLDQASQRLDDPNAVELRVARVAIWADRGGPEALEALAALASDLGSLEESEDRSQLLKSLASAYLRLKQNDLAEASLQQLVALEPSNLDAQALLFDLALLANDSAKLQAQREAIRHIEGEEGTLGLLMDIAERMTKVRQDIGQGEDRRSKLQGELPEIRRRLAKLDSLRPDWARVAVLDGELAELEGDTSRAIASYQRAQKLGDRQSRVAQRLASLLYLRTRFDEADQAIRVLFQYDRPLTDDLKQLAAEISLRADDPQRALNLARETVTADSTDYRAQIFLGRILWASGRPAEAEAAFRRARELKPDEPEPWEALTVFLVRTNRLDEAKAVVRDAETKLKPNQAPLALGRCHEAIGQLEQAEQYYRAALAAKPEDTDAQRAIAWFYQSHARLPEAEPHLRTLIDPQTNTPTFDVAWARRNLALILVAKNDLELYPEILELLDHNLAGGEGQRDDRRLKAVVLASPKIGRIAEAIKILEDLGREHPLTPGEQFLLANLHEAQGNWTEYRSRMLNLLASLGENDPERPTYLASYVRNLLGRETLDEAQLWLTRLERQVPDRLPTISLKAELLKERDRRTEAIMLLLDYARKHADQPAEVEEAIAEALDKLDGAEADDAQHRPIEQELTEALRRYPQSLMLRFDLATLRSLQSRFAEAEKLYGQLLQESQGNATVINNIAWVIAAQGGRNAQALELIDQAIAQHPDDPDLLDTRGFILISMGNGKAAIRDLEEAAAKNQSSRQVWFHLAQAYLLIGDRAHAKEHLEKAKALRLDAQTLHPYEHAAYRTLLEQLASK